MTKFASCARQHGLTTVPDPPYEQGELDKLGFTRESGRRRQAENECPPDALAAGIVECAEEIHQHVAAMLKISSCMRRPGIVDFPDPSSTGRLLPPLAIADQPGYGAAARRCHAPPGPPVAAVKG